MDTSQLRAFGAAPQGLLAPITNVNPVDGSPKGRPRKSSVPNRCAPLRRYLIIATHVQGNRWAALYRQV